MLRRLEIDCLMCLAAACLLSLSATNASDAGENPPLQLMDVFEIEFASDPQISPNGRRIVYVRNSFDVMQDRQRSALWQIDADGKNHRPVTSGPENSTSPGWSPDGGRIVYLSTETGSEDGTEIFCRWMDSGQSTRLTQLSRKPENICWSHDGKQLAFTMLVPAKREPFVGLPTPPKGADWAERPKVITRTNYRTDGKGYLEDAYTQVFALPADGGTARQLTDGDFNHSGPLAWTHDGHVLFSANRNDDWESDPRQVDLHEVSVATRTVRQLTDRLGQDVNPVVSPDGSQIAWIGYDDRQIGSQQNRLYVMNRDGSDRKEIPCKLDRSIMSPLWQSDGNGIVFQYDDQGHTKVATTTLSGSLSTPATDIGGTTIGRPYQSGSFSVSQTSKQSVVAFTVTDPYRPADVAVISSGQKQKTLTSLNSDLFGQRTLGKATEFWFKSSHDELPIQAWLVTPPGFDAENQKKYPLILEIHGGPFANYGWRFSAEVQLYAAAGYAVLYVNPRGSTGYGQKFVEEIHHAYPGRDYDDLMTAVDKVIERGFVDPDQLYVTGGSGGGILTAWVVGKTGRFKAAVAAKPVIDWYSFALTTDIYPYFWQYWFPGYPWEHRDEYFKRSPISLVGNVTTPTMLMTGEQDHRTPITQSEEFYQALKLRGIDTALVRIPNASHGIVKRPSNMINKVAHILRWFEMHSGK